MCDEFISPSPLPFDAGDGVVAPDFFFGLGGIL